jgi:hypothetical protein
LCTVPTAFLDDVRRGDGFPFPKHGLDLAREPCDGLRDGGVGFLKLSVDTVAHVILRANARGNAGVHPQRLNERGPRRGL